MLRAETRQLKGANFASISIDISGLYDNVQWPDLIQDGLALEYPPVWLELCLQVYAGGRLLCGEQVLSPILYPGSGLLQGCPLAPSICKIAMHFPLTALWERHLASHLDLWLDDISIDIEGQFPASCNQNP